MAALEWSTELELNIPIMDDTHKEFVLLVAQIEQASDAQLPGIWQKLVTHTVGHFGQEDRWMAATGYAADNCHATQHAVVLEMLREGLKKGQEGDCSTMRGMLPDLATWFSFHAQTMDAALAHHMQSLGFEPDTGVVRNPQALPAEPISGCGGACSQPS